MNRRLLLGLVALSAMGLIAYLILSPRRGLRFHDPSTIARWNGEYWVFSTGTGLRSRHSKDLITWKEGPNVFSAFPAWITQVAEKQEGHFWAPDLIRLGERYFLYYSVSQWGVTTSAVASATNSTLDPADPDYRWKDEGIVVQSTAKDNFNAIDPSLLLDGDGRLWMAFGSFWSGIKLVELDPVTGLRKADAPLNAVAWAKEIEAPCLVAHEGRYYLFVNWGRCCRGLKSTYEIRVGRSDSVTGPYLDKEGRDMMKGGGSLFLGNEGRYVGPGQAGVFREGADEWLSYHYYDGENDGVSRLALRRLRWGEDGWPIAGEYR